MNTKLTHRAATLDDLQAVCHFPQSREELFYSYPTAQWPLTRDQLAEAYANRQGSTVVLLNNRLAAFANFFRCQPGERCDLGNLMVAPWARRMGIAQHLIGVMEQQACQQHGVRFLHAACFSSNTPGLLLYTHLGYLPVSIDERRDPSGQRTALIHLRKRL
ncbi:GNAT family N-acetyltransferase [Pseudomonas luteola]|uniref:GNAT family N-acetyltransferase n=1 Tax=Pseudomonas TaxID=286 RepID=UPI00123A7113|nr:MULTISPECIES: GNAT family N-acetyltransferase [Pseudomonas]MBA1248047.1 GNAT family N-acetyltransferase [Pseudomonas zeshuii]QEU30064.1 GNAT family N-acetyltransferase [Pseudomonas luteola]